MYRICFASIALLAATIVSATNNFLDVSPEERPEIAIQKLCATYPDLQSCQTVEPMEKRKSAYMRFGRSSPMDLEDAPGNEMEKRKSAYMRFGKRSEVPEMEKRKSAYMRFGKRSDSEMPHDLEMDAQEVNKRKSAYMRFGKRAVDNVMDMEEPKEEMMKRKSAYMRFGKRSSPLLYDGESEGIIGQEVAKRKSAYMRFGR